MVIESLNTLEGAAVECGILPFFPNCVRGLSVQEMCSPGLLFGGNIDEGCWEWKGPVIRKKRSAYGKFFQKKAGFVSLELMPDFLNYRRSRYPIAAESTEALLLDIIRENDGMTSTDLKSYIFGDHLKKRNWYDVPDHEIYQPHKAKRKSLESPLQRLQMGGWLVISDFVYKRSKSGERYGWGVAKYSTPELNFGEDLNLCMDKSPRDSLNNMIERVKGLWPTASKQSLLTLLS
ncbi:MAG: hypothetical protein J1E78_01795 [Muribaculaceae bacterium]|nr:hypothetical protein [Muribaculaceae bacterium]